MLNFRKKNEIKHENLVLLDRYLPPRQEVKIPMDAEECTLVDFDPRQNRTRQEAYDDDDPRQGGPTQVNCATH